MKRLLIISLFILQHYFVFSQAIVIHQLNSLDFKKELDKRVITLIDVRTQMEFAAGHINGSSQLNYYAFDFKNRLLLLAKNQPIYLYCNTGYRSNKAAAFLVKNGYSKVYNLEKGIMEWNYFELPVVISPGAKIDEANRMEMDEYKAFIENNKLVFVDFYAPWCAPCRRMMPMIDSVGEVYSSQVKLLKVNADASKKLIKELEIIGVPYLVLYKNGKIVFSHKGVIEHELIMENFNKNL